MASNTFITPEYDLIFVPREATPPAGGRVNLVSSALDSRLCCGQSVPIILERMRIAQERRLDGLLTLESVQARSIEAFLCEQAMVRRAVEADMTQARQSQLGIEGSDVDEMWSDTVFSYLYLPNRELIAIEDGGPETVTCTPK